MLIGEKSQVAASRLKMWQLENEGARSGVGRNSSELSAALVLQCSELQHQSVREPLVLCLDTLQELVCIISDRTYIGTLLVTIYMLHV